MGRGVNKWNLVQLDTQLLLYPSGFLLTRHRILVFLGHRPLSPSDHRLKVESIACISEGVMYKIKIDWLDGHRTTYYRV
jgi:hypothetical protein